MPQYIIDKLKFRNIINNIFIRGINKKEVRDEFIYKIPDLGFRGEFDVNDILEDEDFIDKINDKVVLSLISDSGYLECCLSKYCRFIYGVVSSSCYLEISQKMRNFYKKDNILFNRQVTSGCPYDVIMLNIGNNMINNYLEDSYQKIYEKHNIVLFRRQKIG